MKFELLVESRNKIIVQQEVDLTKHPFSMSGGVMSVKPNKPFFCSLVSIKLIDNFDYRIVITDSEFTHIIDHYESNSEEYHPNCFVGAIIIEPNPDKKKPKLEDIPKEKIDKLFADTRKGKFMVK